MCTYVYPESARTWYVYMYVHVFFVTIGVDNEYVILFISSTTVY